MMRKITILLTLLLTTLAWMACEQQDLTFKGPYFVRFTEATDFERESYTKPIDIEVHLAGRALDTDLRIFYKITGSAREGVDFEVISEPNVVQIDAGEYTGNIEIKLINNANNILRSQDIVFTLIALDDSGLQIGQGLSAIGKSFTYTIFDDCILGGDYQERSEGYIINNITSRSTDCEIYKLSGVYFILDNGNNFYQVDFNIIDNGDNTITVPSQTLPDLPDDENTIIGSGVVNPLTREIILTITLTEMENQPQVTLTLLPV